ncbi:MAG TPA: hypothetical protein PK020_05255 [Ilumatobacteraceae bacterium]|nr:hypothetical protein [Ilumatobacteraceae bacterium]HRB02935.1 hypothetical protein [Ilumatobacteraceae bacterium]
MARQTALRRAWTGVALTTSLVAIGAGAWGLQRWAPFADAVADWPDNVRPVVEFVEGATGQRFVRQVTIEYIADSDQYRTLVQPGTGDPTDEERATAAADEGVARALGLWAGDGSVIEFRAAYASADPLPVTWFADTDTIAINAQSGSELSPLLRAELSVRLTQALDNQLFRTIEQIRRAPTSQEYQALVAISIGHALWVHDLYVDNLAEDERTRYSADSEDGDVSWAEAMADVPLAYRAIRAIPQQIGPMFVEALAQTGRTQVARALSTSVPVALDQISLPARKYLRPDATEHVTRPPGPAGADVHSSNQMGPFALYLLFSTGMPLDVALTASDGWGNDRYTAYTLDGRVCVDVHVVADSPHAGDLLEAGLDGWARARPEEADVLIGRDGLDLYATACDPGVEVGQSTPTATAVQQYLARAQVLQRRASGGRGVGLAECVAVSFYGSHDNATMDETLDFYEELRTLEQNCLSAV